ncbi:uncharacterized protein B0H18DRAFT_57978 [Fomitopsis serialis]|uniref:uncharacterized protein n=1 Tax=Fomitopsis serialis TaxID=139415 RepID=UPI002007279F|nr:uncharacterized protein B0H18DRAFT_57978 [Neoantrodia serialis]KAH9916833.1 hypothetical protein B0H18DRAFT_57978 [Neoantrodia serialis]
MSNGLLCRSDVLLLSHLICYCWHLSSSAGRLNRPLAGLGLSSRCASSRSSSSSIRLLHTARRYLSHRHRINNDLASISLHLGDTVQAMPCTVRLRQYWARAGADCQCDQSGLSCFRNVRQMCGVFASRMYIKQQWASIVTRPHLPTVLKYMHVTFSSQTTTFTPAGFWQSLSHVLWRCLLRAIRTTSRYVHPTFRIHSTYLPTCGLRLAHISCAARAYVNVRRNCELITDFRYSTNFRFHRQRSAGSRGPSQRTVSIWSSCASCESRCTLDRVYVPGTAQQIDLLHLPTTAGTGRRQWTAPMWSTHGESNSVPLRQTRAGAMSRQMPL